MKRKYKILILIILIGGLILAGYFFIESRKGKILKYEAQRKLDDFVYQMNKKDNSEIDKIIKQTENTQNEAVEKEKQNEIDENLKDEDLIKNEIKLIEKDENLEGIKKESSEEKDLEIEKENLAEDNLNENKKEDEEIIDEFGQDLKIDLPAEFKLNVKFVSQAPSGNWGEPYQEACEEASLIIASKFFEQEDLSAEIMDREINDLVAWEMNNFGYYKHTDADEVLRMAEDYFDLEAEIIDNPDIEILKDNLYRGKLILIPAAGRELKNPYFSGEGPIYHMLVLIGWKGERWITNDHGTRRGENFSYPFETLMSAIANPPFQGDGELNQEMILKGEKKVIILSK